MIYPSSLQLRYAYLVVVKNHFKVLEVIIFASLCLLQLSISILCFVSKRIETPIGIQQQAGRCLQSREALICTPFLVHMNAFYSFLVKGEGEATEGGSKVDCHQCNVCQARRNIQVGGLLDFTCGKINTKKQLKLFLTPTLIPILWNFC